MLPGRQDDERDMTHAKYWGNSTASKSVTTANMSSMVVYRPIARRLSRHEQGQARQEEQRDPGRACRAGPSSDPTADTCP